MEQLSRDKLIEALKGAGEQHHEYQANALGGKYDEQWAGWYAAYVLGALGTFASPSRLSGWLEEVPVTDNWTADAADYIASKLSGG